MAERPIWRGHLRPALVSCPVALCSVLRASGGLRFHFINPKTGHRVPTVTLDAETDKEVPRSELVRATNLRRSAMFCSTTRISPARASRHRPP